MGRVAGAVQLEQEASFLGLHVENLILYLLIDDVFGVVYFSLWCLFTVSAIPRCMSFMLNGQVTMYHVSCCINSSARILFLCHCEVIYAWFGEILCD